MKLTKQQLKQLIKEELKQIIREGLPEHDPFSPEGREDARTKPVRVDGPTKIYDQREGRDALLLVTVRKGESVMIEFESAAGEYELHWDQTGPLRARTEGEL